MKDSESNYDSKFEGVIGFKDSFEDEDEDKNREENGQNQKESQIREFMSDIIPTPNVGLKNFKEFNKYTIMIVEDNFINMKILIRVLSMSGMKILTAKNGLEAVEKVKNLSVGELHLILMDINMPVMDGYAATEKIRQYDIGKDLPIIALSALSLETEFKRMVDAQIDGYIPKPLDIGRLYTVFTIYLTKNYNRKKTLKKEHSRINIKGIDTEVALEYVNNDDLLLKEVFYEFISLYGDSDKEIKKLYLDRRYEQLKQYLFDLIGLASAIGAKDLAFQAKEMRKLYIYDNLAIFSTYLVNYSRALTRVKNSLRSYLSS